MNLSLVYVSKTFIYYSIYLVVYLMVSCQSILLSMKMCQYSVYFRQNWQYGALCNSKTTGPIFDLSTPFSTYLLGLQKTEKSPVSKSHSFLTNSFFLWNCVNFRQISLQLTNSGERLLKNYWSDFGLLNAIFNTITRPTKVSTVSSL